MVAHGGAHSHKSHSPRIYVKCYLRDNCGIALIALNIYQNHKQNWGKA